MNRRRLPFLAAFALAAACGGGPHSPYVRVAAPNGRVYYTDSRKAYHSEAGGFLTFRDLVTGEQVRLENGTYLARTCPRDEVWLRQREYMDDPTRPPRKEDYEELR